VSDGRIRPGDKLLSANGVDLSTFSHQVKHSSTILRVVDLHCFNADPGTDPAFFLITDPDLDPVLDSGFDDQKLRKN
jgi:hypothetical protein